MRRIADLGAASWYPQSFLDTLPVRGAVIFGIWGRRENGSDIF